MHIRENIEVAGLLCLGARNLLEDCPRIGEPSLNEYWMSSRCRLDAWSRTLRELNEGHKTITTAWRARLRAVGEEVLLSGVLARSVAALCVAHDRRRQHEEAGPVARNVLAGHAEAERRLRGVLRSAWPAGEAIRHRLDEVAKRAERWTDLLIGHVAPLCGVPGSTSCEGHAIEFAIDPARAQEFAYDAQHDGVNACGGAETLLTASLRQAFSSANSPPAEPELNRRVAGAALGLIGPEAFDGFGLLRSASLARIERATNDALGLVEQLFDETPRPPSPAPDRFRLL